MVDVDACIAKLLAAKPGRKTRFTPRAIKEKEVVEICKSARECFLKQPCLLHIPVPVKLVGDIHGQYADLLRIFRASGHPPQSRYLFLGDYIDRGEQGLEVLLLLLCYKIRYPDDVFLLRGNHESAPICRMYGFYDEVRRVYRPKIFQTFVDVFNTLPLAAVVGERMFCVHGGLSPQLTSLDQIDNISRPTEVPDYGLLCDLLWADPCTDVLNWAESDRGVSYIFGRKPLEDFLQAHGFDIVVRGHQVVDKGYEFMHRRQLVTLFSAPNYAGGEFDNSGAVMCVDAELLCSFQVLLGARGEAEAKEEAIAKAERLAGDAAAPSPGGPTAVATVPAASPTSVIN